MNRFQAARKALGWSLPQTAEALVLSLRYVREIDKGDHAPHPHTLLLMETWAAPWFPAAKRPRPQTGDAGAAPAPRRRAG